MLLTGANLADNGNLPDGAYLTDCTNFALDNKLTAIVNLTDDTR